MKITIKRFKDGIAFYKNKIEIAFYSSITKRITYNWVNVDPEFTSVGCSSLDINDNIFIMNKINEYIKEHE